MARLDAAKALPRHAICCASRGREFSVHCVTAYLPKQDRHYSALILAEYPTGIATFSLLERRMPGRCHTRYVGEPR